MMRHLAWRHFERGRQFELQSKTDEAIEAYRSACNMKPTFPEPFFALAKVLAGRGGYVESKTLLDEALNRSDSAEIYEWRGYVHGCLQAYDAALVDYELAIEGGAMGARINMGRMLLALRRFDEAVEVLEQSDVEAASVLIEAIDRYREFDLDESLDGGRAVRYLFGRTLVLGSRNDGGLRLARVRYVLLTANHIAVTLQRFMALVRRRNWQFDAVCGGGAHHGPLAALIAAELDVALVPEAEASGRVLLVSAAVEGEEAARALRRAVTNREAKVLHFALAFAPNGQPSMHEPDIVGSLSKAAVPWYRVSEQSRLESDDTTTGPWPGFKVGVPFIDPNRVRVVAGLQAAAAGVADDPLVTPILDWYCEQHPQTRAFEWETQ
jgi:tetratricopeptide (TPR) repeat protein